MATFGSYENDGTGSITVAEGGTLHVDNYVNRGDSFITVEQGSQFELDSVELVSGTLSLEGEGSYNLGAADATFTVSGDSAATATATTMDISRLSSRDFVLEDTTSFTLNFTDELLLGLAAQDSNELRLTLITRWTATTSSGQGACRRCRNRRAAPSVCWPSPP